MAANSFFLRERTPVAVVLYGLYLYFSGLSLRGVSKALEHVFPRSHTAVWLWLAIEPYRRKILGFYRSRTRNILVAELFLARLKKHYGARSVYTDGTL